MAAPACCRAGRIRSITARFSKPGGMCPSRGRMVCAWQPILVVRRNGSSGLPGVDIPTSANQKRTTPSDVREAVKAAFAGGAEGIVLSRKYSEMMLANLAGAGQGVRDAGVLS